MTLLITGGGFGVIVKIEEEIFPPFPIFSSDYEF